MQTVKEAISAKLVGWINNPHTSSSALVFVGLKIAGIIWPTRKATLDEIASLAVAYGFLQAGDAKPKV